MKRLMREAPNYPIVLENLRAMQPLTIHKVGDIIEIDGKRVRITKVDFIPPDCAEIVAEPFIQVQL